MTRNSYVDFERLFVFTLCSAFFVVRTKQNVILQRRYSHPVAPGWALPFEGWQALNRLPDHFNILRIIWAAAMLNFVTVTQL